MTVGKAQVRKSVVDRMNANDMKQREQNGLLRRIRSGNVSRVSANPSINPPQVSPSQTGLPITGGSMVGPIGLTHKVGGIIASVLNISDPTMNSSFVVINSGGPNLQAIAATSVTDAVLVLSNGSGGDLTLKQAVSGGMNIDTATHADITFFSTDTIVLIYNHNPGIWHQLTTGSIGGSSSSGANTSLSNISSVAASASMNPGASITYDQGSAAFQWKNAHYGQGLYMHENGSTTNYMRIFKDPTTSPQSHYAIYDYVDGTWASSRGHLFTTNYATTFPDFHFAIEDDGVFFGRVSHRNVTRISGGGSYTLANTFDTLFVDSSSGQTDVHLPAVSALYPGKHYWVIKTDSSGNNVVIHTGSGSDTIIGNSTIILGSPWDEVELISDGVHTWGLWL